MVTGRADINSVLTQMRELQAQAQAQIKPPVDKANPVGASDAPSFGNMLNNAVNAVNSQQMEANQLATSFEQGDPNVDLTQVMISMQKASLSFQAMTQVRNRLVTAYEDIMRMTV
jgi:flagellar hook-basal body complex protein FliE